MLFQQYEMLEQVQEMKIRREILDAKNFLFVIRYQVLDLGDQVECLPLSIAP